MTTGENFTAEALKSLDIVQVAQKIGELATNHTLNEVLRDRRVNSELFANAINPPSRYPYESYDFMVSGERGDERFFVHQTFPADVQEDGEAILKQANLGFFQAVYRGDDYTVRQLPVVTIPLLSHEMGPVTSKAINTHFLAPVIEQLYKSSGLIPSRETMANIVHVEKLGRTESGDDTIELGPRFIPPYRFESVVPEDYVEAVLANAADYGQHVIDDLSARLDKTAG